MAIFKNTPPIVTSGLVLHLDTANRRSYVSGSTTWSDMSGNGNSGSLVGGPTFDSGNGGSIVFDGVDDSTIISTTPTTLQGNKPFSVSGWFRRSGNWTQGATWGIGGSPNSEGINSYILTGNNFISIDLWGTSTYQTDQTYSLTEWKHVVWTYNGTSFTTSNIIIYVNTIPYTGGNLSIGRGGSGTPNINSSGIVLGRASVAATLYYGKPIISNFSIYNRVLSAQEVKQNYDALKTRFNLS
jgi:hypothetical protein